MVKSLLFVAFFLAPQILLVQAKQGSIRETLACMLVEHGKQCGGNQKCPVRKCDCINNKWECLLTFDQNDASCWNKPVDKKCFEEGKTCGFCTCELRTWRCEAPVSDTEAEVLATVPAVVTTTTTVATTTTATRPPLVTTLATLAVAVGEQSILGCSTYKDFSSFGSCPSDQQGTTCSMDSGDCPSFNAATGTCQSNPWSASCKCDGGTWICDPVPGCMPCECSQQMAPEQDGYCSNPTQVCGEYTCGATYQWSYSN